MKGSHMTPKDLAARWDVQESTLGQWRWFGKGPSYLKICTLVLYRIEDIENFEALAIQHMKNCSSDEVFSKIQFEDVNEENKKGTQ